MKPRAILWDLFGDHLRYIDGGRVPMRALTQLLDVFGVGESTSRVVLSRMRREGWFTTYRDGRQTSYALTARSSRMLDEGRARIFDRGRDDWDGTWRMVIYVVPEESRAERDRVRRTLAWHGFGPLAAATWISPHPRLDTVRSALADLSATRMDLLESRSLSRAADREMAFRCWDLEGLGRDYIELINAYEQLPTPAELAALSGQEALRRQVEFVASYRALPFRDPDLPTALLPEGWQGRRAHTLFTAAHDALHVPADAFVRDVVAQDHRLSTLDEEVTMAENFVLVHGAWHGGWAWQLVASRLRAAGGRVSAPTCPGLGINDDPRDVTLADCVDSVVSQVEASSVGDITLVGHSWGGYVIAGAAPRLASRLKRLVFWSAFVPEAGRSLHDEVPPQYQELFAQLAGASGDNTVALPLEVFQGAFMGDAVPAAAAVVHSVLRPQPYRTFTDPPADGETYRNLGIPLHYVLSADDVALPPGEYGWDRFAERIKTAPVSVPGSHESMFTRPAELADALIQVATAR